MFILKRKWEKEKLNKTQKMEMKSLILSKYDTFISHIIHLKFQTVCA